MKAIVPLLLLLVACSTEPGVPSGPEPLPVAAATPEAERVSDADEIVAKLGCAVESRDDDPQSDSLRARVTCTIEEHRFVIWHTVPGTDAWDQVMTEPSVKGPGWIVVALTGEADARYAQSKLGGELHL